MSETKIEVTETPAPPKVLRCKCGKSARFVPMYRFAANAPSVAIQPPAAIKCAECGQWYHWDNDGWVRTSQLDDLDLVLKAEQA